MKEIRHLTVETVLKIHQHVLAADGGSDGLRDLGLLESAISAPQATFGGQAIMADTIEIAAAYLFYLCNNHPFIDGNKRTALASCLFFLQQNSRHDPAQSLPIEEWETFVLDVAASKFTREETTVRLEKLLDSI